MTATTAPPDPSKLVDAPELVRDLLRPDAYPEPRPANVELRSTHASWVFLTSDRVWKVKRPVDFGFLDFRTLEARQHACEDELRLNRRLAPDVYLDVVPVRRAENGPPRHLFGGEGQGDGPTVDWAVLMRRLPDQASASALLAAGQLGPERLEALAARLAAFFAAAPRTPAHGTPEALRRNVEENLAQTRPLLARGDLLDAASLDEIWKFQDGALAKHAGRFAARAAAGWIREGHGDLRLEHVYFLPDRSGHEAPIVLDCIEFNDRFRCGDVAGELGFLAMELEVAGRPDLAAGFVARAAEALGDFDLYGVLDFYVAYRAWIRAKIAGFVAGDDGVAWDWRTRKVAEARRDFALARALAGRPADAPALIAVGGVIGSGKSTLAAALGRALSAPVVSSDRTRKALAGLGPTARADGSRDSLYTHEKNQATYAEILRRAGVVLASGRTVIVDATFNDPRWLRLAADHARGAAAEFVLVEASCPDWGVLRGRLRARSRQPSESDAGEALLDEWIARGEPPRLSAPPDIAPLIIDTRPSPPTPIRSALAALAARGIRPLPSTP